MLAEALDAALEMAALEAPDWEGIANMPTTHRGEELSCCAMPCVAASSPSSSSDEPLHRSAKSEPPPEDCWLDAQLPSTALRPPAAASSDIHPAEA